MALCDMKIIFEKHLVLKIFSNTTKYYSFFGKWIYKHLSLLLSNCFLLHPVQSSLVTSWFCHAVYCWLLFLSWTWSVSVLACSSSRRTATWEGAGGERGGIHQQFQRGNACGQDPGRWAGCGAQNWDVQWRQPQQLGENRTLLATNHVLDAVAWLTL